MTRWGNKGRGTGTLLAICYSLYEWVWKRDQISPLFVMWPMNVVNIFDCLFRFGVMHCRFGQPDIKPGVTFKSISALLPLRASISARHYIYFSPEVIHRSAPTFTQPNTSTQQNVNKIVILPGKLGYCCLYTVAVEVYFSDDTDLACVQTFTIAFV